MGIWYEYSAYPFAFEIGKKCIYANYSLIDNSTVSVVNAAINRLWVRKKSKFNQWTLSKPIKTALVKPRM